MINIIFLWLIASIIELNSYAVKYGSSEVQEWLRVILWSVLYILAVVF